MPLDKMFSDPILELLGSCKAKLEKDDPQAAAHLADAIESVHAATIKATSDDPQEAALKLIYGRENVQKLMPSGPPAPSIHTLFPFNRRTRG